MLFVYEGEEEELSTFGFNVLVNKSRGKRTVSVDLPISTPKDMITLVDNILERHDELGSGGGTSPLDIPELDMAGLDDQHTIHKAKRKEANKKHGLAEPATQKADKALGTTDGQTSDTKGTVYNLVARVRDRLLFKHPGEEEEATTYGFNVVISMSPMPGEDLPETFTGNINGGETIGITDTIADESAIILRHTGPVDLIFCRTPSDIATCDPVTGSLLTPGSETVTTGADMGPSGKNRRPICRLASRRTRPRAARHDPS